MTDTSLFSEQQISDIIAELEDRFRPLNERLERQRNYFYNDPSTYKIDLGKDYERYQRHRADVLRQAYVDLDAAVTQNQAVVRGTPPRKTSVMDSITSRGESVFNAGWEIVQLRQGFNIQQAGTALQVIDGGFVLHWRTAKHIWPDPPEPLILDYEPEEDEAGNYEKDGNRYVETRQSRAQRHQFNKARSGFPWAINVLPFSQCRWAFDDSLLEGPAYFTWIREIPVLDYARSLQTSSSNKEIVSINQAQKSIRIGAERGLTPGDGYLADEYKRTVSVVSFWTRDCWYELAGGASTGGTTGQGSHYRLVKHAMHDYSRCPFEVIPAIDTQDSNIARRYLSPLEGLYQMKPVYDRQMTLTGIIVENAAIPLTYLKQAVNADQIPPDEDENIEVDLAQKTLNKVKQLPPGMDVAQLQSQVSPAVMNWMELLDKQLKDATPQVGIGEVGASTQPYTLRLEINEKSKMKNALLNRQIVGYQAMIRNMAHCMSGWKEEIVVYERGGFRNGKKVSEQGTVVSIKPEEIKSVEWELFIDPVSAQERITTTEHMAGLYERGLVTLAAFYEQGMGENDPQGKILELNAEKVKIAAQQQILQQAMTAYLGPRTVVGADGNPVGPGGVAQTPEQALLANKLEPIVPPTPPLQNSPAAEGQRPVMPPMPPEGGPVGMEAQLPGMRG